MNWGGEVESMWTDDGYVLRLPDNESPIDSAMLLPSAAEMKELVLRSSDLHHFSQRSSAKQRLARCCFRAAAQGSALRCGSSANVPQICFAVAARFSSFPILLESYRECIRDVFDLPAVSSILTKIQRGEIRVSTVESEKPSPLPARCFFLTSRTTSTTATHPSPNAARKRCRSTNHNCRNARR